MTGSVMCFINWTCTLRNISTTVFKLSLVGYLMYTVHQASSNIWNTVMVWLVLTLMVWLVLTLMVWLVLTTKLLHDFLQILDRSGHVCILLLNEWLQRVACIIDCLFTDANSSHELLSTTLSHHDLTNIDTLLLCLSKRKKTAAWIRTAKHKNVVFYFDIALFVMLCYDFWGFLSSTVHMRWHRLPPELNSIMNDCGFTMIQSISCGTGFNTLCIGIHHLYAPLSVNTELYLRALPPLLYNSLQSFIV